MAHSYLGTNVMRATSSTMELASNILGFEIVELWTEIEEGKINCTYVHVSKELLKLYPDVISGHYPEHKREHQLSPTLCKQAKESPSSYVWNVSDPTESLYSSKSLNKPPDLHPLSKFNPVYKSTSVPFKTEMAYLLDHLQTEGVRVYIVGFSIDNIKYKASKLKFLSGLNICV
jgi:hypothetical protein